MVKLIQFGTLALTLSLVSALSLTSNLTPLDSGLGLLNASNNANSTSAERVCAYALLPYTFNVPGSHVSLRLGFGLPRRSLNKFDMRALLAVVKSEVDDIVRQVGPAAYFAVRPDGRQVLDYDLGDGIRIFMDNTLLGRYFTVGTLQDTLHGLQLYLIDGERFRQTYFHFYDGNPGLEVGSGCIEKGPGDDQD
ncbi:hypothetical protein ACLMJK_006232 [Lecanora helva]